MKIRNYLVAILFFLPSTSVLSMALGDSKGNGGDVIVCQKGKAPVEVLDVFEARVMRGFQLELGGPGVSLEEKLNILINRLEAYSPGRASRYREWGDSFLSEAQFFRGMNFGDVEDSDHILIPSNCKLKQIIIQQKVDFPEDRRYMVNEDLWDQLDNDNKAALVLHELIYRELQSETSVNVRYFNSFLFSNEISRLTHDEFKKLLERVGPMSLLVQGVVVDLDREYSFYPSGILESAYPVEGSLFYHQGHWSEPRYEIKFFSNGNLKDLYFAKSFKYFSDYYQRTFEFWGDVHFYKNGKMKISTIQRPMRLEFSRGVLENAIGKTFFHSNGVLASVSMNGGYIWQQGERLELFKYPNAYSKIEFFENGSSKLLTLNKATDFILNGREYKLDMKIIFDDRGNILSASTPRFVDYFIKVQNKKLKTKMASEISFYPTGQLQCFILGENTSLRDARGVIGLHEEHDQICLDRNEHYGMGNID